MTPLLPFRQPLQMYPTPIRFLGVVDLSRLPPDVASNEWIVTTGVEVADEPAYRRQHGAGRSPRPYRCGGAGGCANR